LSAGVQRLLYPPPDAPSTRSEILFPHSADTDCNGCISVGGGRMAEVRRRRARAVTTQDVAHAAAVSRVTVSRVLNNHGNVTERTRQRVLQAAADVGYLSRPPRPVPPTPLSDIGFFFASILGEEPLGDNPFWTPVLHGVEQEASAAGIHVTYRSITPYADRPGELLELVRSASLDGVLLVGPASEPVVRTLHETGVP